MSERLKSVTVSDTNSAYTDICAAIASLDRSRVLLANYHYHAKKVDDIKWLLDNVGRYASPSDDAHEMLHFQLEVAKQNLRDAQSGTLWSSVRSDLETAYKATDSAWETLKKHSI